MTGDRRWPESAVAAINDQLRKVLEVTPAGLLRNGYIKANHTQKDREPHQRLYNLLNIYDISPFPSLEPLRL
jgi:hypothetical protein